jgi:hypothetical protein
METKLNLGTMSEKMEDGQESQYILLIAVMVMEVLLQDMS